MSGKLYDLVVTTGSYLDSSGQSKNRYQNMGALMENKEGGKYILINKTFNPAGVPSVPEKDSIAVSLYKPREETKPAAKPPEPEPEYEEF